MWTAAQVTVHLIEFPVGISDLILTWYLKDDAGVSLHENLSFDVVAVHNSIILL